MSTPVVIALPPRRMPLDRLSRILEAKRRLHAGPSARAWINGREAGGPDRRFRHLAESYD